MKIVQKLARRFGLRVKRRGSIELDEGLFLSGAAGIGVGLMYFLDPDEGARRRALVRDKGVHLVHRANVFFGKGARDLRNRSMGVVAETRSLFEVEDISDERLASRVRSKLGRAVSHPHAIEVEVEDGCVTLKGPVLAREVDELLSSIAKVEGVSAVDNQLEVHARADSVPALQGARRRTGRRFELLQESWSPVVRIFMGTVGAGLVANGLYHRDRNGAVSAALGAGILVRGIANRPLKRLLGVGAGRRAIDFQKTVTVDAPVEAVFDFFTDFENFPRFMSHVKEVKRRGEGRFHWVVSGPAHSSVGWDAVVTQRVTNELIAWKSVPGAIIRNAGIVRFEVEPNDMTRIDIRMSYNPPAGIVGHALASVFRVDPKHALDDDMLRFKSLIEGGKTRAHGEAVRREQIVHR